MAVGDPGTHDGWIKADMFKSGVIPAAALATDAVETAKIKDLAVTTGKINNLAVTAAKLATDAVETLKIKDLNVTTDKIAANAVTLPKLVNFSGTGYILRGGALGVVEEYDASTDAQILIGDGTDIVSVPVTGAVAITNAGLTSLTNPQVYDPGAVAMNTLYYAGDVLEAEQITIGADVYEYEVVNTDSTDNTGAPVSDFNALTDPLDVELSAALYPAVGVGGTDPVVVGRLIRIQNEILRVTAINGDIVTFARGVSNTVTAVHADALDIFVDDGSALQAGTTVRTGLVAVLTAAVATDAVVADINAVGTESVFASGPSPAEVLIQLADAAGGTPVGGISAIATTDTLSQVGSGWYQATLVAGRAAGLKRWAVQTRTMAVSEATFGVARFCFDFTPTVVFVSGQAGTGLLPLGVGATISGGVVTLTNDGGGDFVSADVITVLVVE